MYCCKSGAPIISISGIYLYYFYLIMFCYLLLTCFLPHTQTTITKIHTFPSIIYFILLPVFYYYLKLKTVTNTSKILKKVKPKKFIKVQEQKNLWLIFMFLFYEIMNFGFDFVHTNFPIKPVSKETGFKPWFDIYL